LTAIDLSEVIPSQLVVWLAAKCGDEDPGTIMDLGPIGELTLDELAKLAQDAEGVAGSGPDLGAMGNVTLGELRAIAADARSLRQIVSS